jgi:predicted permease
VWLSTAGRDREFVLGDLDEEFRDEIVPALGVARARRWYWRQAWRCVRTRSRPASSAQSRRPFMAWHQDVRFALRLFRGSPGFTLTAVVTLTLGIGATTAIYAVVHAVVLAPLPFDQADRLTIVRNGPSVVESTNISYPTFLEWRASGVFEILEASFSTSTTLTSAGADPEQVTGLRVSGGLLSTLGVSPIAGTFFRTADEPRQAPAKVIIGEGLWRRRFGGSPEVIGRPILLGGVPFTVVGVLPASFRLRPMDDPPQVVTPLRLTEAIAPASLNFMRAHGRLRPGQTPAQAKAQLEGMMRRLRPDAQPVETVTVIPLRDVFSSANRQVLLVLLGAVGCLLLITCANLANLLLARATERKSEMALRLALGAGRLRLARQLLTESLVLAVAGGGAGALAAWLGVMVARDLAVVREAGAFDVTLSIHVLLVAFAVSVTAGALFGLAPALVGCRQSLRTTLGHASRVSPWHPLRAALIVAEVALTLVLLAGSGLLVRSFVNLLAADPGFSAEGVITFALSTPSARYRTSDARTQFFESALGRLAAIPGVTSVGVVNERPFTGNGVSGGITIEGETFSPGQLPDAEKRIASPDYFRALGIRLVEGRAFTDRDTRTSDPVAIVSESFARRYLADRAIGRRIGFQWDMDGLQTVIGVVADVKHYGLDEAPIPTVYVSYLQRPIDAASVVVKTAGGTAAVVPALRDTIRRLDRDIAIVGLETMDASLSASVANRRFLLWLSSGFATLALVLAATGIFGIVSYAARARTREFGIRMALGANGPHIVRLAAMHGAVPVVAGLALGAVGALFATRLIESQLFGVTPDDPFTIVVVIASLASIALGASLVPALRTVRLNPVATLRRE